jgi:hypothetical protein
MHWTIVYTYVSLQRASCPSLLSGQKLVAREFRTTTVTLSSSTRAKRMEKCNSRETPVWEKPKKNAALVMNDNCHPLRL